MLTALLSLYLNVFVLVIQSFLKVPALHALAPSVPPAEPPFAIVQGIVLVSFVVVIIGAIRRYRPASAAADMRPQQDLSPAAWGTRSLSTRK